LSAFEFDYNLNLKKTENEFDWNFISRKRWDSCTINTDLSVCRREAEETPGEDHYQKPYKKIKNKKTFTKQKGARPNHKLVVAAPSPQFFPLFFPNLRNHSFTPTFKRIPFDLSLLNQSFPPHDQPTQQGSVE